MSEQPEDAGHLVSFMNCSRFEEIVHDLDRPGYCETELRESALAHAESCGRCAQLMTDAESLDFSLHSLATREGQYAMPAHLESALLGAFRNERQVDARYKRRRLLAMFGAAAALLLAVAGAAYHRISVERNGDRGGQNISTASNAPNGDAPAANRSGKDSLTPVATNTAAANSRSQSNGQSAAGTSAAKAAGRTLKTAAPAGGSDANGNEEMADAFVQLPYADDPTAIQNGSVVRVVLSPAGLASLGLPVTAIGSGESVPADLLLSEDGTPQAVRLVAASSARYE
jgi:hypothetical protein